MKQYNGLKSIEQIKKQAPEQGWEVNTEEWDSGKDWIELVNKSKNKKMLVNYFGRFIVYQLDSKSTLASVLATESNTDLDNEEWYNEILDLLYVPLRKGTTTSVVVPEADCKSKKFIPVLPNTCPYCASKEVYHSGVCIFAPYPAWTCKTCCGTFFVTVEKRSKDD